MTGQSGQKTTGGKISPLSKFVSTPGDGENRDIGAGDPLYEITEVNNGISASLSLSLPVGEREDGKRKANRITKFRNNRGHARESYSRESIIHAPVNPTRPSFADHRSSGHRRDRLMSVVYFFISFFFSTQRNGKKRREEYSPSRQFLPYRPNYTGGGLSRHL